MFWIFYTGHHKNFLLRGELDLQHIKNKMIKFILTNTLNIVDMDMQINFIINLI